MRASSVGSSEQSALGRHEGARVPRECHCRAGLRDRGAMFSDTFASAVHNRCRLRVVLCQVSARALTTVDSPPGPGVQAAHECTCRHMRQFAHAIPASRLPTRAGGVYWLTLCLNESANPSDTSVQLAWRRARGCELAAVMPGHAARFVSP
jgi:hypothetical protein